MGEEGERLARGLDSGWGPVGREKEERERVTGGPGQI
jgi:hypothetical protein